MTDPPLRPVVNRFVCAPQLAPGGGTERPVIDIEATTPEQAAFTLAEALDARDEMRDSPAAALRRAGLPRNVVGGR